MGAGGVAAAAVGPPELSPRGLALAEAESELRRDLATGEELRRELDFLEKGGDPLDLEHGEAVPAALLPLPRTESLSDEVLSISTEALVGRGGAIGEKKRETFPENEPDHPRGGVPSVEKVEVDRDCIGVVFCGSKPQMLVKRNRARSVRLLNGHASPQVVEHVSCASRGLLEVESDSAPASLENEAMSDVSYEVLPSQSSHGLPRKWPGLISSQEFESGNVPRRVPVSDPPASADASSREPSPSHASVQSVAARFASNVDADERERVSPCLTDVEVSLRSPPHVAAIVEPDALASPQEVEDIGVLDSVPGPSKEETGALRPSGSPPLRKEKKERVFPFPMEKGSDMHRVDGVHVLQSDSSVDVLGVPHSHRHSGVVKKSGASRVGTHGRLAGRERSSHEERRVGVHHVRIKCEDGVAESRARPSVADAEPCGEPTSGGPSSQEDLRSEGQAGAVVGGIPRAIVRSSSVSALSTCKSSGVVLPWKQEQDPVSESEVERCKSERRAEGDKAHDDYILEEAGKLQAKRSFLEKWHHVKKCSEPSRRKCHWDFVLEEMRWLAKDFFEERRWKLASAARIGHKVSYEKNRDAYLALDLVKEQRDRARFMAYTVNKFWRMAESSLTKGKPGRFLCDESAKAEEIRRDPDEAVPMDVDVPAFAEAVNKSSQPAKVEESSFSVKSYAVNYLKFLGCGRVSQAVAPLPPDHYFECNGIPYFFDGDLYSKELLYYTVPAGAMEAYRVSVEMERSRAELEYEEKRAAAVAEAESLAAAEASGDASLGSDFVFPDFLVDDVSQDYEFQTSFMGEGGHARISKKKRKKIFKNSNSGRRLEGVGLQGFSYPSSGMSTPELGLQSPVVAGKRSLPSDLVPNSVPGSIPVKRARSSATNLRPRANHSCISPGGHPRTGLDSQDQHEDDVLGLAEGSLRVESGHDTSISKVHGVGGFVGVNKLKKKKKTKAFSGLSNSRPYEGGLVAAPPGKGVDGDSQDVVRFEQMKRKVEPSWAHPGTSSDASLGTPTDPPGSPGSQGLPVQPAVKKPKSLKPNETSGEAAPPAQHGAPALPSVAIASKLLKQSSMRDRNRRARPTKVPSSTPAGVGIPWSTHEDHAILALVHDLGPNFELVSDVLSSNSQIKGIFRKPKQCRERHVALTERSSGDAVENQEDPSSLQLQCSKGNVKGPRVHGVAEEDSLKHLECIVQLVPKYRVRKTSGDGQDQKTLAAQHPSHGVAISQFCTGGPPNPLDLCDRVTSNGDATSQPFPVQPAQGSVLGPPLLPGSVMKPPSGGLPLLPGTSGFTLGPSPVSSSAAMSAAAARDAQRFTTRLSQEEANRLRMAGGSLSAYNARRLQQQSVPGGLPLLSGLPNPSDLPMVPTSSTGSMLGALSRGLSLPRAGLPSMGSPVVSNMVPSGLSGMVPPSGSFPQSNMSRRPASLLNMLRVGSCTEDQRLQVLNHLQSQAQQGDSQAAAALSSLGIDMAAMTSPPPQPFSPQQQSLQPLQQQQQHFQPQPQQQVAPHQQHPQVQNQQRNQLQQQHMQMQANPQAYYAAAARMKEHQQRQQQQQSLQQLHQKQRLLGPHPPAQHMLVPPHVPSLPPQQLGSPSHLLSQGPQHASIPKQVGPQQVVGPPPVLGASAPASPAGSGQSNPPNPSSEPLGPSTGSSKAALGKPTQTPPVLQQLPSPRSSTGPSRVGLSHDLSSQAGQASPFVGSGSHPPVGEGPDQMHQAGQKMHQRAGPAQGGSASSGPQSKVPQQSESQPQLQMPQGGVPKQQQGASIPSAGPSPSASIPTSSQQVQQPLPVPSAQQMQRSPSPHSQQPLQQPQRRLQTRHLSANPLGMAMPGLLGKTGLPPSGPAGSSQMSALPSHHPYQLGGTAASIGTPISLSNSTSHGVPLHSSSLGAHSMQWKPNQASSPLSSGLYNLTRATTAAGTGPVSGPTTTPGLQLPSFHGPSHGLPLGSLSQGPPVGVSVPPKHGLSPGVNGRAPSGAQASLPPVPRGSQANGSSMVSSTPSAPPPHTRPAAGVLGPGGGGVGASPVPYARVPASESSSSMASPMLANSGQTLPPSVASISQRPAAAAAASPAPAAIGGSSSPGISTLPPGGPGPGLPEATTPVSSS